MLAHCTTLLSYYVNAAKLECFSVFFLSLLRSFCLKRGVLPNASSFELTRVVFLSSWPLSGFASLVALRRAAPCPAPSSFSSSRKKAASSVVRILSAHLCHAENVSPLPRRPGELPCNFRLETTVASRFRSVLVFSPMVPRGSA